MQFGLFDEHPHYYATLADLVAAMMKLEDDPLFPAGTNMVIYRGNPEPKLMIVGEAPGTEEDRQGKPFVGRAGQKLTEMLAAVGITRDEVYICNIVKCRPPGNRNPESDEIAACTPFLAGQLAAIRPGVIGALGTFAAQYLLRTKEPISRLRGRVHPYPDAPGAIVIVPGRGRGSGSDVVVRTARITPAAAWLNWSTVLRAACICSSRSALEAITVTREPWGQPSITSAAR